VTLARLADGFGELRRLGFDCGACMKDEELRRSRGCGEAPVAWGDGGEQRGWDAQAVIVAVRSGEVDREDAVNYAYLRYTWSNVANIWQNLGEFWDCCPAWWARFYDGRCVPVADAAIEVAAKVRRGFGPLMGGVGLEGEVMRAALQAHVMMDSLSNHAQEREMEARMGKTGGGKPKR